MARPPINPNVTNAVAPIAPRVASSAEFHRDINLEIIPGTNTTSGKTVTSALQVRRMFKDCSGAYQAYKRLKQQNVERNKKNQLIQKKLNNEPPYSTKKLQSLGQDWRSNRPTGFISTMITRLQAPYCQVIDAVKYLTLSSYPGETYGADTKTKTFREAITKTIRGWSGYDDFNKQVIHENTTFGYAAATWDDPRDWKPEFLRQDYTFFSIETPQVSNQTPIWGRKRRYQVCELIPVLEKPAVSTAAGWNIKNLVKSINAAVPAGRSLNSDDDARRVEDWLREGSYGASYENDAKYVELGEICVREPNGKVSRFLFDDKSGAEVCTQLDRYGSMNECLALFSIEVGSGSLMSSRGAGRDLYNTHIQADKSRNLIVDSVYLNGMLVLRKGTNAKPETVPLTVLHPVCYVGEGYEIVEKANIPANVENFLSLDRFITGLAEIQIGTFLPGQVTQPKQTKQTASEVNRVAAIENQLRQGILMRWSKQYSLCVERMQRGIAHPEHVNAAGMIFEQLAEVRKHEPSAVWAKEELANAFKQSGRELPAFLIPFSIPTHLDEDAIACCVEMMDKGLTAADILVLAYSPAIETVSDTSATDAMAMESVVGRYTGNPSIDGHELMTRDISAKLGEGVAKALVLPKQQADAVQIEAAREQLLELQAIMNGTEVPVSPRDDDMTHLTVAAKKLAPLVQILQPNTVTPQLAAPLQLALKHLWQHVAQAQQKGVPPKALAPIVQLLKQASTAIHAAAGLQEPPEGTMPAAAHAWGRGGRHAPQGGHALPAQALNAMAQGDQGGQAETVANIAAPPKPATAA